MTAVRLQHQLPKVMTAVTHKPILSHGTWSLLKLLSGSLPLIAAGTPIFVNHVQQLHVHLSAQS